MDLRIVVDIRSGWVLCNAHLLWELVADERGRCWAEQVATALLELKTLVEQAIADGKSAVDPTLLDLHTGRIRSAALIGANTACRPGSTMAAPRSTTPPDRSGWPPARLPSWRHERRREPSWSRRCTCSPPLSGPTHRVAVVHTSGGDLRRRPSSLDIMSTLVADLGAQAAVVGGLAAARQLEEAAGVVMRVVAARHNPRLAAPDVDLSQLEAR